MHYLVERKLVGLLGGMIAFCQCCMSQTFEVQGTTVHQIFSGGSNILVKGMETISTNKFTVSVSGCKFKVHVELPFGQTYETGFEDQTLFTLISIPTPSNAVMNAIVESNEIPPDDGTAINYLWLAYASSCYFAKVNTNRLTPIWMMDDPSLRDSGFTVPGYWECTAQPPHLPMQVVYLSDGIYRGVGNEGSPVTFKYRPPFDMGFTNAEYKVLTSTNVGELVIPTQFSFTRYYVTGQKRFVRTLTQAYVSKVQLVTTASSFRTTFSGRVIAFDKRFITAIEPVPVVRFWLTNGNWPRKVELSNSYSVSLEKYQASLKTRASESKWSGFRRKISQIAFGLLVAGPLILIVCLQARKISVKNRV